jgi:TAT (twin-arginine translocation) pathway signal sequence
LCEAAIEIDFRISFEKKTKRPLKYSRYLQQIETDRSNNHENPRKRPAAASGTDMMSPKTLSRRDFLAGAAAAGATILTGALPAAAQEKSMKKTFTILHTNDMHSAFIGMGPSSDYTPFKLHDDKTRGGYARLAGLIAKRKDARKNQGPVLVLDAGDYSMGTAFGAASRPPSVRPRGLRKFPAKM